ncbi:ATP-binding protein [Streptomyces sp. NK15101]|uniref:ATP-binding protein n=1 Tax=Streptomyces sp. NK15101 TaxID=2873261 RepID=UPI001CED4A81|nr:ATP-binding protein [Streptomyces sp. NK15101]
MTGPPIRHATARTRRYELAEGDGVVRKCRDLARRALSEWFGAAGEPGRVAVEDALLLVSEVVTNAFTHGGVPYELRLDGIDGRLWVQVSDTSPVRPRPHGRHHPSLPSGHGLYLLERLAAAWGCVPRAHGKAVWFEVEVTGRPDSPDEA